VTKVGKFIRHTSIDELPNLFNVWLGQMSLVGPRPELPHFVERYQPWQHRRLIVPQGMTGWWQINGRSDKPLHLHTEDDIYYVQNYSLWLDVRILIRTAWVVIMGKGAY
jgi:lipopolysaccharide/colanic/teichoic acid biosynthesis glycosyltransferase